MFLRFLVCPAHMETVLCIDGTYCRQTCGSIATNTTSCESCDVICACPVDAPVYHGGECVTEEECVSNCIYQGQQFEVYKKH